MIPQTSGKKNPNNIHGHAFTHIHGSSKILNSTFKAKVYKSPVENNKLDQRIKFETRKKEARIH